MSLQEKRLALETQIMERALADEGFKERLLKNPHGAIAELGVRIPKDVEIQVLEESAKVAYLVLPYDGEELSDYALDLVAGGCECNAEYRPPTRIGRPL